MPAARTHDPDTSHAAARRVSTVRIVQDRVEDILRDAARSRASLTDDDIFVEYSARVEAHGWTAQSPQSVRSRRAELVRHRRVRMDFDDDGIPKYGKSGYGNPCHLWTVAS